MGEPSERTLAHRVSSPVKVLDAPAHADNLDGGPRLPGRGLDAAFVQLPWPPARCDGPSTSANTGRSAAARAGASA